MDPRSFLGLAGVPVVLGLVQAVKVTFPKVPSNYWPIVTLAVALVFNEGCAALLGTDLGVSALVGLVTGLSASGLYSYATVGK
jgi:hypothetical protein